MDPLGVKLLKHCLEGLKIQLKIDFILHVEN